MMSAASQYEFLPSRTGARRRRVFNRVIRAQKEQGFSMVTLNVNGVRREVQAPDDTPLLYVLRNDLQLIGPQFGCGLAQCGACSVLVEGKETRSCVTPVASVANQEITTLEGLPARWAKQKGLSAEQRRHASPRAAGLDRGTDSAMRILPERHDDQGNRTARKQSESDSGANQSGLHHVRRVAESVPLRNLRRHHGSRTTRRHDHGEREVSDGNHEVKTQANCFRTDAYRAVSLSKRAALWSWDSASSAPELLKADTAKPATFKNSLDPTLPSSWIEIHPDNTILIRTGKSDFGQGTTFTAYRQIVAEELSVPFEAITTVVAGDTDRTPDGSGAFDFLGRGTPNIRKAAAYTYQALLDLASERLGVPKDKLSVKDGIVSGGGKSISYGDLVKNQQLKLTIPGEGRAHQHYWIDGRRRSADEARQRVHGHRQVFQEFHHQFESSGERNVGDRCAPAGHVARARGASEDARLDARFCRSKLDKTKFPNSQVIVKGNLVGVVAPTEWEAIQAAEQVAGSTKWTDWKGLPGNAKLYQHLREEADWTTAPVAKSEAPKGMSAPRWRRHTRSFPPPISCLT